MNKDERKEYARIDKEMNIVSHKMEVIRAKTIKDIWTDPKFDKAKLKDAELVLRLDDNPEYKALQEKYWELDEQGSQLDFFDDEDMKIDEDIPLTRL